MEINCEYNEYFAIDNIAEFFFLLYSVLDMATCTVAVGKVSAALEITMSP